MPRLLGGLAVLALLSAPNPERADCGDAVNRYKAAVGAVFAAVQVYASCVATSARRHDCAAEIQALDSAHDDFADALADVKACQ